MAFPTSHSECGMNLRDYFAAAALTGFLAASMGKFPHQLDLSGVAGDAYDLADAMLAAREDHST